jgi:hypothetical protein
MSYRPAASQAVLTRAIKAALAAGLKSGEFEVFAEGGRVRILTHRAGEVVASADQDDDAWAGAMAKWRRSA